MRRDILLGAVAGKVSTLASTCFSSQAFSAPEAEKLALKSRFDPFELRSDGRLPDDIKAALKGKYTPQQLTY